MEEVEGCALINVLEKERCEGFEKVLLVFFDIIFDSNVFSSCWSWRREQLKVLSVKCEQRWEGCQPKIRASREVLTIFYWLSAAYLPEFYAGAGEMRAIDPGKAPGAECSSICINEVQESEHTHG